MRGLFWVGDTGDNRSNEWRRRIIRLNPNDRRHFIGGSDARIIMEDDQESLIRLWREKRGEPEDLSDNLICPARHGY
ncbi:UNVERIFIED_ORG: putative phage-related endonuclease [Bradyrhizobium japonicum]